MKKSKQDDLNNDLTNDEAVNESVADDDTVRDGNATSEFDNATDDQFDDYSQDDFADLDQFDDDGEQTDEINSEFDDDLSTEFHGADPDLPLESTIEIIAKPKGKRPLSINQLSGGEKTLTATSLLFSIYLLKPAPFCIFDEVDAPLDDANIDKFNQIIQKFSNESQFIIVTHNKRTMASTDIIYGITMIETGVSRVVPVDLRELIDEEASSE